MSYFDFVDKVVYINLAERTDRKDTILAQLKRIVPDEKVVRFDAIKVWPPTEGCPMSHIAVLEMAKANRWKTVMVLEDDAILPLTEKFEKGYASLVDIVSRPYDAIVLGLLNPTYNHETKRVTSSLSTVAYIVSEHYYDTLIGNLKEGLEGLQRTGEYSVYALDQWWWKLMEKDKWFGTYPSIFIQDNTHSSISGGMYTARDDYV